MTPDSKHLMGELVFESKDGYKIYRQDAGMGEYDYAVFRNEVFFCRTNNRADADEIIGAVRFAANMRNADKHDELVRNEVIDEVLKALSGDACPEVMIRIPGSCTGKCNICVIESLRPPKNKNTSEECDCE